MEQCETQWHSKGTAAELCLQFLRSCRSSKHSWGRREYRKWWHFSSSCNRFMCFSGQESTALMISSHRMEWSLGVSVFFRCSVLPLCTGLNYYTKNFKYKFSTARSAAKFCQLAAVCIQCMIIPALNFDFMAPLTSSWHVFTPLY